MIVSRIMQIIDYKHINKRKFYKETGLSNGFLDKVKDVGVSKIENILSAYPDINPIWLLTGKGNMLLEEPEQSIPTNSFKLRTDQSQENQEIPLYNIEAAAGLVELFQSSSSHIPIDTLRIPNLPKCDGAVFVTGDSMYPLLKSGDIVAYKQIHDLLSEIFWGEMYLISVEVGGEEYISVKYIQKSDEGKEYIKLVSQNSHHQPKDVELSKVRAMALIKASIRINSMK